MKTETTQNPIKPIDEALADIPRGHRSSQVSTATRQGFSAKGDQTMSNSGTFSSFENSGWNAGGPATPDENSDEFRAILYKDVVDSGFDAGVYREWLTYFYGQTLRFGGSADAMRKAHRHSGRLAHITRQTKESVIDDICADSEALD